MNWINSKIVMLHTDKRDNDLVLYVNKDLKPLELSLNNDKLQYHINQHLYFTSDEEIKKGDWFIFRDDNTYLKQCNGFTDNTHIKVNSDNEFGYGDWNKVYCHKIIRSTDKSLSLPEPSKEFLELYCKRYNEGNKIEEVLIEYEEGKMLYQNRICSCGNILSPMEDSPHECCGSYDYSYKPVFDRDILKVNPDNTINIKPIKETWNKEEYLLDLQYYMEYCKFNGYVTPQQWLDEFKHY